MEEEERRAFAENRRMPDRDRQSLFDALWKHWHPRLEVYLRTFYGLSLEDCEELAGDALLKAFERAELYRPELSFDPWLIAITRRLALSRLRSQHRRRERTADLVELGSMVDERQLGPEAARATGSPLGTVKWRMHSLRGLLQRQKEADHG
ncbi:hypothetical protein MASR2M48_21270 [Spirochaetota bacterium]